MRVTAAALLVLAGTACAQAGEFSFLSENFGKKFNNRMRELELSDRVSFGACEMARTAAGELGYSCDYAFDGAKFILWSTGPYQPARTIIILTSYDAEGAEALQAAGMGTVLMLEPALSSRDALTVINSGLDRAADTGKYGTELDRFRINFQLNGRGQWARIVFRPPK